MRIPSSRSSHCQNHSHCPHVMRISAIVVSEDLHHQWHFLIRSWLCRLDLGEEEQVPGHKEEVWHQPYQEQLHHLHSLQVEHLEYNFCHSIVLGSRFVGIFWQPHGSHPPHHLDTQRIPSFWSTLAVLHGYRGQARVQDVTKTDPHTCLHTNTAWSHLSPVLTRGRHVYSAPSTWPTLPARTSDTCQVSWSDATWSLSNRTGWQTNRKYTC